MSYRPPIYGQPPFGNAFSGAFGGAFSTKGAKTTLDPILAIANLALLLDADRGIIPDLDDPTKVATWADQTDNANNATGATTDSEKPTFNSVGNINGKKTLTFLESSKQHMSIASAAELSPSVAFSVYAVCRPTETTLATIFAKDINADYRWLLNEGDVRVISAAVDQQSSGTTTIADNESVVVETIINSADNTLKATKNGADMGGVTFTIASIATSANALFIGKPSTFDGQYFNGEIRTLVFFPRVLTLSERNIVVGALGADSGITVVPVT